MKAVFTARRLNAGHYDDFRKAWEPEQWPAGFKGAYLMRDTGDPDQITAIGLFDVSDDDAARLQADLEPSERDRHERMAPHIAETLWEKLGHARLWEQPWPVADESQLERETFELVIQVNGKVRDRVEASVEESEAELIARATASPRVQAQLDGKEIRQAIVVRGKLVNLVV